MTQPRLVYEDNEPKLKSEIGHIEIKISFSKEEQHGEDVKAKVLDILTEQYKTRLCMPASIAQLQE